MSTDEPFDTDVQAAIDLFGGPSPFDFAAYDARIAATAEYEKYCREANLPAISAMITDGRIANYRSDILAYACEGGYLSVVELLLTAGFGPNSGMDAACGNGHRSVVKLLLAGGGDPYSGFYAACKRGDRSIVDLLISTGGIRTAIDWNGGLKGACAGGHRPIVDLMLSNGANDFNEGMTAACEFGHRPIIDLMISKGAKKWTYGLLHACIGGHPKIVQMMVDKGAEVVTGCSLYCDSISAYSEAYRNRNSDCMAILLRNEPVDRKEPLNAADDPEFWLNLLQTTDVTRDSMANVRNIRKCVFDRADRLVDATYDGLAGVGFPDVLQTVVVDYVINSY
jgi:hypothetical protein